MVRRRPKRRKKVKQKVPVLATGGFFVSVTPVLKALFGGDFGLAERNARSLFGGDGISTAIKAWQPAIFGGVGSIAASKSGLNRMLRVPFIKF